jgi:hypothetical protein
MGLDPSEKAILSFVTVIGNPTQKFGELGSSWLVNHQLVISVQLAYGQRTSIFPYPYQARTYRACNPNMYYQSDVSLTGAIVSSAAISEIPHTWINQSKGVFKCTGVILTCSHYLRKRHCVSICRSNGVQKSFMVSVKDVPFHGQCSSMKLKTDRWFKESSFL